MSRSQRLPVLSGPLALGEHFSPATPEQWRTIAEASLKGRSLDRLGTTTIEGLVIRPLNAPDDENGAAPDPGYPGLAPLTRGNGIVPGVLTGGSPGWITCQQIDAPDPETCTDRIATELARGAGAVWIQPGPGFSTGWADSLGAVLQAVLEAEAANRAVYLDPGAEALATAAGLVAGAAANQDPPRLASLRGSLGCDPLGSLAATGELPAGIDQAYDQMADLACWCSETAPGLRAVTISTLPAHDAGATAVHELAFTVATGLEYLRALTERGLDLRQAVRQLHARLAIGRDLFCEIAKLRALRRMWSRVLEASLGEVEPGLGLPVHAVTSWRTLSVYDPWVNLLRGTTQTLAAILGGAEVVTTRPFDTASFETGLGGPGELGRRMAVNTQTILREESHLDRIADPAGGSWYVERLTDDLAHAAWSLLQILEARGGMGAALRCGHVADLVAGAHERRLERLARRVDPITGISSFPNLDEKLPERAGSHHEGPAEPGTSGPEPAAALLEQLAAARDRAGDGSLVRAAISAVQAGITLGRLAEVLAGDSTGHRECLAPLQRHRDAEPFEELRRASDEQLGTTGARPQIFMANLGTIPEHKARSTFAQSLLQAGGFATPANDGFTDAASTVAAFRDSGASVAVLCSTDARYQELVPDLAPALKQAGARTLLLAGRPGAHEAAWRAAGIDRFLYVGCDVLDTLVGLHATEGVPHA